MPQRLDVLGPTTRASLFAGRVLHHADDEVLQRLVGQAAEQLGTPIALVSLVLDHVQHFRAQVGLPADLQRARGTDRDQSFCQIVVAEGEPLAVTNAPEDERVPQALVDRYGIRAYLGVPIRVKGAVAGSLCVIDTTPRPFSEDDRRRLQPLADAVSARLDELAAAHDRATLLEGAARPAFGELRNLMMPLTLDIRTALAAATELGPFVRWLEDHPQATGPHLPAVNEQVARAFPTLVESLEEIAATVPRLRMLVDAMDQMVRAGDLSVPLEEVFRHGANLAHHQLRLVGGLSWPEPLPPGSVIGPRSSAIASTAAVLSEWAGAQAASGDIRGHTAMVDVGEHDVRLTLPLSDGATVEESSTLDALLRDSALVALHRERTQWVVTYSRGAD